jgi:hypothetical protein
MVRAKQLSWLWRQDFSWKKICGCVSQGAWRRGETASRKVTFTLTISVGNWVELSKEDSEDMEL